MASFISITTQLQSRLLALVQNNILLSYINFPQGGVVHKDEIVGVDSFTITKGEAAVIIVLYRLLRSKQALAKSTLRKWESKELSKISIDSIFKRVYGWMVSPDWKKRSLTPERVVYLYSCLDTTDQYCLNRTVLDYCEVSPSSLHRSLYSQWEKVCEGKVGESDANCGTSTTSSNSTSFTSIQHLKCQECNTSPLVTHRCTAETQTDDANIIIADVSDVTEELITCLPMVESSHLEYEYGQQTHTSSEPEQIAGSTNSAQIPAKPTVNKLCLVCQVSDKRQIKELQDHGAEILACQLEKFSKIPGAIPLDLHQRLFTVANLEEFLKCGQFVIHKACYDSFNNHHYERLKKRKSKSQDTDGETERPCKSPKVHTRSQVGECIPLGKLVCMFCNEPDKFDERHPTRNEDLKLHAAAGKSKSSDHVESFTKELREMACVLGDSRILALLSVGDARSQEFYYHLRCLAAYRNRYRQHMRKEQSISLNDYENLSELAALDAVHSYVTNSEDEKQVFELKELESVYLESLREAGIDKESHTSRFSILLADYDCGAVPIQKESSTKRMAIRKASFERLFRNNHEWFSQLKMILKPIREEIVNRQPIPEFSDLSTEPIAMGSISIKLRILISMLCNNFSRTNNLTRPLETICQLIEMNTKKFSRPSREMARTPGYVPRITHGKEAQIPQILTLKLCKVIRAKTLTQFYFHHGIIVSPTRWYSVIDEIAMTVLDLFAKSGMRVLPSTVRIGIFSVLVDDNLDENSSSSSSTCHFHGAGVSMLQFPAANNVGEKRRRVKYNQLTDAEKQIKISEVLNRYTEVKSVSIPINKSFYPLQSINIPEEFVESLKDSHKVNRKYEMEWLETVEHRLTHAPDNVSSDDRHNRSHGESRDQATRNDDIGPISWTAHHASKKRTTKRMKTIATSLPVIYHVTNDPQFQYHVMNIAVDYISYVNPSQTAVSCSDQPLYARKKKIQWLRPNEFPITRYFPFLGGLHIEQVALKAHGTLIKGTGLAEVIQQSGLKTIGLQTAVTDVNDIKKARYTLQVITTCLYKLLKSAFESEDRGQDTLDEWAKKQDSVMFRYWFGILNHEINTLMLVRSFRESNLKLLMSSCEELAKMFFALDHTMYARWLPVFIHDLKMLSVENPELFAQLSLNMSVCTSGAEFSDIAYDQRHEQLNKDIKSTSGYINLVNREDHDFLRKLEMSCTEINQFLAEMDQQTDTVPTHKEQAVSFVNKFVSDCQKVYSNITVNPFSTPQFQKITLPMYIYPQVVAEDSNKIFVLGETQYNEYLDTRFVEGSIDVVSGVISRNSLKLPKDSMVVAEVSPLIKLSSPVLLKLRNASEQRRELVRELFGYEFTNVPESLFDPKKLMPFHNAKSKLVSLIAPEASHQQGLNEILATGLAVDLSTVTRPIASSFKKQDATFEELIDTILEKIMSLANAAGAKQIDIVADFYDPMSVKGLTRKDRGISTSPPMSFQPDSKIPKDMEDFLNNSKNKENLNSMIAKQAVDPKKTYSANHDIVVSLVEGKVLTSNDGMKQIFNWIQQSHEEADNRLMIHLKEMILESKLTKILVRSIDTDVMIILISFMPQFLQYDENVDIWLNSGVGDNSKKTYHINKIFDELGESICLGLPFFHTFSGSDSTSSFFEKPKRAFFEHWMAYDRFDDVTRAFQLLSWLPTVETVEAHMDILERFITTMYAREMKDGVSLNEVRFQIYVHEASDNFRKLPPSKDSLLLHVKRSAYQAGWIWGNTLSGRQPPSKFDWGWTKHPERDELLVQWIDRSTPPTVTVTEVTSTCKCKSAARKCQNCGCGRRNIQCLTYCNCKRLCQ